MSVKLSKVHLLRNKHNTPSSSSSTLFKTNLNIYRPSSQKNFLLNESQSQLKYKINNTPHIQKIYSYFQEKNSLLNKNNSSNSIDFHDKFSHLDRYSSILSNLEYIISIFKEDETKLNNILLKIEDTIKQVLQEYTINNENSQKLLCKSSSESLNRTFKSAFYSKSKLKGKLNPSQDTFDYEQENNLLKNKIKHLYKKITEIDNKFKTEKLNYLFCIGQYQYKINSLEEKLNLDSIDKMPKEELKKLICYPHYIKFDVNEDNPKSKNVSIEKNKKNKCQSSYKIRRGKNNTLSENGILSNSLDYSNKDIKNNNIIEFFDDIEKIKTGDLDITKSKDFFEDVKKIIEVGKKNFDAEVPVFEKFLGKRKKYFLSHPKINYVRNEKDFQLKSWKVNNQIDSLPKSISKLKTCTKSQKNAMVVFPSSLNETLVNLEKLRIKNNFKNILYKFEEQQKNKRANKALESNFRVNGNANNS